MSSGSYVFVIGDTTYTIDWFDANDTWVVPTGLTNIDRVLRLAGGGSGGDGSGSSGGGGGAGGLTEESNESVTPGASMPVVVGAGGVAVKTSGNPGVAGGNTSFNGLTVLGGGPGGAGQTNTPPATGGSGAGGGASTNAADQPGGLGTVGQGNAGGDGSSSTLINSRSGAGGGGKGGPGVDSVNGQGNGTAGGPGVDLSADWGTILGLDGKFAAGGGGGGNNGASGGAGGVVDGVTLGGKGGNRTGSPSTNAVEGTGSGGGGCGGNSYSPASDGSGGVLALRYIAPLPPAAPANMQASYADEDSIQFAWTPPNTAGGSADSYEVRINGGTPVASDELYEHTFTGLTSGTEYVIEVRGINSFGDGAWATIVNSTVEYNDTPWHSSDSIDIASKKWMPFEYLGLGVQLEEFPDLDISNFRRSEMIPIVKDGANMRVDLRTLFPQLPETLFALPTRVHIPGTAAFTSNELSIFYLTPGTYRVKANFTEDRGVDTISGGSWFNFADGSTSQICFSKRYLTVGTDAVSNAGYGASGDLARLMGGKAQRVDDTVMGSNPSWNGDSPAPFEFLTIYEGVVVVTSPTILAIKCQSGTGGGNHTGIRAGSILAVRKVA